MYWIWKVHTNLLEESVCAVYMVTEVGVGSVVMVMEPPSVDYTQYTFIHTVHIYFKLRYKYIQVGKKKDLL